MSAYLFARLITPDAPDVPKTEAPPQPPPPPLVPPSPVPTGVAGQGIDLASRGTAAELEVQRRRRGVGSTVLTSPLGIASMGDTTRLGG